MPVRLSLDRAAELVSGTLVAGGAGAWATGVSLDSRQVRPGDIFVALAGLKKDGAVFARAAAAKGAVAVLAASPVDAGLSGIVVSDPLAALRILSAAFAGNPEKALRFAGVTGTNGKTTTTFLIQSILAAAGRRAGIVGTVFCGFPEERRPSAMTTPDPPVLYGEFARIRDAGGTDIVMEVSSHALAQRRVEGIRFDVAVMTNLTRDHLDYHKTMEAYRDAKGILFRGLASGAAAVLNADDPAFGFFREISGGRVVTFSLADAGADYHASIRSMSSAGTVLAVRGPGGAFDLPIRLVGRYNAENALAAAAAAEALGAPRAAVLAGLATAAGAPGRLERVSGDGPFPVFVDYAHTDDALRSVLANVRGLSPSRLIVLFGCGGDRDPGKRPMMARVAEELADAVYITSDNPRTEDPESILDQIEKGFSGKRPVRRLADRREAIRAAIREARPGDCVLIAGKGHEDYQIFRDRTVHFDDREEARAALMDLNPFPARKVDREK